MICSARRICRSRLRMRTCRRICCEGGEMLPKPYFQDDAVTIYHGENKHCDNVLGMVDCNNENTYTTNWGGKTSSIQDAKTRQECCHAQDWTTQGVQAISRAHSQTHTHRGIASRVERRQGERQSRTIARIASIRSAALLRMRQKKIRAASHRRQHTEQRAGEYRIFMPKVPHGKGWSS